MQYAKRQLINYAKNKPCADCHVKYPPCVMDFDHREPWNKKFNIGAKALAVDVGQLAEEIIKCDVVCANCHRLRTWKQSKTSHETISPG